MKSPSNSNEEANCRWPPTLATNYTECIISFWYSFFLCFYFAGYCMGNTEYQLYSGAKIMLLGTLFSLRMQPSLVNVKSSKIYDIVLYDQSWWNATKRLVISLNLLILWTRYTKCLCSLPCRESHETEWSRDFLFLFTVNNKHPTKCNLTWE